MQRSNLRITQIEVHITVRFFGMLQMRFSVQSHCNQCATKEPMNPLGASLRRFLWCTIFHNTFINKRYLQESAAIKFENHTNRSSYYGAFLWNTPDEISVQSHSNQSATKEPMNPLGASLRRFLWCTMLRVTLDHSMILHQISRKKYILSFELGTEAHIYWTNMPKGWPIHHTIAS